MSGVTHLSGETTTPRPEKNTLVLTDNARDTITGWLNDDDTNRNDLTLCMMTLIRMGARGWMESPDLIVFDTGSGMTVGMLRDVRRKEVTLHS